MDGESCIWVGTWQAPGRHLAANATRDQPTTWARSTPLYPLHFRPEAHSALKPRADTIVSVDYLDGPQGSRAPKTPRQVASTAPGQMKCRKKLAAGTQAARDRSTSTNHSSSSAPRPQGS